jgi:hypothetical protein
MVFAALYENNTSAAAAKAFYLINVGSQINSS